MPKYRLTSIIFDVVSFWLFKAFKSEPLHDKKIIHIPFSNIMFQLMPSTSATFWTENKQRKKYRLIVKINLSLLSPTVTTIPLPVIVFTINKRRSLLTVPNLHKSTTFGCDLNIIQNKNLRKVRSLGPKFIELLQVNWYHKFKITKNAGEY